MKKLYAVGVGGSIRQANIEIHDVQFVVADSMEDTYETLKANWYGDSLHLDEYKEVTGADGYRIEITDTPYLIGRELYFMNMGGYRRDTFGELHEYRLYVSETGKDIEARAEQELLVKADSRHEDNLHKVEDIMKSSDHEKYYIRLIPDGQKYDFEPDWSGYLVLKRK